MLQNAYFLAKSMPIQTKTSNILPKFCRSAELGLPGRRARKAGAGVRGRALSSPGPLGIPASPVLPPPGLGKLGQLAIFSQIFAIFWPARSRLYQNEILQENMRLTAFFKLYM